jgi:hypothetical protein
VLEWNSACISLFPQAAFKIIVNDESDKILKNYLPHNLINRKNIENTISDKLTLLVAAYQSMGMSERINYGIDFEFKCFERFFLIKALSLFVKSDFFVHIDCDLALSSAAVELMLSKLDKLKQNASDYKSTVVTVNNYSTYLSCFSPVALDKFCEYISSIYLINGIKPADSYRVSDMGALQEIFDSKGLIFSNLFDDIDKSFLAPDLMSFQPLASNIANDYSNENNSKKWWRMDDVMDQEIINVAKNDRFFKFFRNGFKITRDKSEAYFTHFHGPSKRFIKFCELE